MVSRSRRILPAIAGLALFVAACGGAPAASPTAASQPTSAPTTAAASATTPTTAATTAATTPTLASAATAAPTTAANATTAAATTPGSSAASDTNLTYTIESGTTANFRVREQLVGHDLPSDAVGKTSSVTGQIVLTPDGKIDAAKSKVTVDVSTLKSDESRRDGYIKRSTLETDQFPTATFVPNAVTGLPSPLPTSGEVKFQLTGDLTVHGVSHPVTWSVTATVDGGKLTGQATTPFRFDDFGMTPPKAGPVLSVTDNGTLEVAFNMAKG
ncbi:MAG TPA: YceI family protein [Chloroflexota bacterium]|nr:YceI family protein [Chloroflexota bacterium]